MKQLFFVCVLLCCVQSPIYAQKKGQVLIDSLLKELPIAKEDTNKVKLLNIISENYVFINPNEMMKYGQEALSVSQKLDWNKGIAKAYGNIGRSYAILSDYATALENYNRALNLYQELGDKKGVGAIYSFLSFAYNRQSKYPLAIEYNLKALKICEELDDKPGMGTNLRYIGIIYSRQKDYSKAEEYFLKALKIYQDKEAKEEKKAKIEIAQTLGNLGEIYRNQNKYTEALDYDSRAIKAFEEEGHKPGIATNLGNIAEAYKMQGNFEVALSFTFRALKIAEEIGDKSSVGIYLGNIGENYLGLAKDTVQSVFEGNKSANIQKAIQYLNQGIAIVKEINIHDAEIEFSKYLADAYRLTGDYKKALELTDQYQSLKDSIFSVQNTANINAAEKKYYLDLKDKDLKLAQVQLAKERSAIIFYVIGIVLLVVVVGIILKSNRTQKKLNETISKLVNEQEKIIEQRTSALAKANKNLLELIQYNAHNLREPLTRIMGAMLIKEDMPDEEFNTEVWPQMKKATHDLDTIIKEVIDRADKAVGS